VGDIEDGGAFSRHGSDEKLSPAAKNDSGNPEADRIILKLI
jgi:hypothetical protein